MNDEGLLNWCLLALSHLCKKKKNTERKHTAGGQVTNVVTLNKRCGKSHEKWLSLKVTRKTTKNVAHKRDISATERSGVPLQCHLQLTQEQQSLERRP